MNWKVLGIFGAFGFVLSLIAGIFGGVSFGAILLRSLIAGIVFGGLGFGILTAVNRFLPELAESGKDESFSPDGGGIDIVLEAETPAPAEQKAWDIGEDVEVLAEDASGDADSGGFIEEVQEARGDDGIDPLARSGASGDDDVAELEDVTDGIDALPDIGEFADGFSGAPDRAPAAPKGGGYGDRERGNGSGGFGPETVGKDVDAHVAARAVQTIMKKDE